MAPVEKTAALCKQTALLVKQSVQEIAKLHERNLRSQHYIEGARTYIETACGLPVTPTPIAHAAFSLAAISGEDSRGLKRAQELRVWAQRIVDAAAKREMLEIAELYDKLSGVVSTPSGAQPDLKAAAA